MHCEVRWLSAAKCLSQFFAIGNEIFHFLQEYPNSKAEEYFPLLTDASFLCELSLIVDLTNHMNTLNLKLQKPSQTISQL